MLQRAPARSAVYGSIPAAFRAGTSSAAVTGVLTSFAKGKACLGVGVARASSSPSLPRVIVID